MTLESIILKPLILWNIRNQEPTQEEIAHKNAFHSAVDREREAHMIHTVTRGENGLKGDGGTPGRREDHLLI